MKKTVFSLILIVLLSALLCSCSYELKAEGFELLGEVDWEDAKDFSEGFAAVKKDGKWGFINTDGELIIDCVYDSVGSFSEGLCAVQTGYEWDYIDADGKTVIDGNFEAANKFSEGRASVMLNYKYCIIDTEGNNLFENNKVIFEERKNKALLSLKNKLL